MLVLLRRGGFSTDLFAGSCLRVFTCKGLVGWLWLASWVYWDFLEVVVGVGCLKVGWGGGHLWVYLVVLLQTSVLGLEDGYRGCGWIVSCC